MLRVSLVTVAAAGRAVVPFQYGWRFHYGDDSTVPEGSWPAGPGTCAFEEDLQDFPICEGMEHAPNRFSEKDCRTACCYDENCLVWQAFPIELGRECYHGYKGMNVSCKMGEKKSGMGGGRRAQSPAPAFRTDYAFAEEGAEDEDWELVDAPHDFIAERGNFSNDSTNFKQGYLPRNASWYRKHFRLPAEWKEGNSYVHFEAVFHRAEVYLNGRFLLAHDGGYTGFTVRLDNASNIRYGDGRSNVLAVRADASYGSGHWYEGGGLYRLVHLVHTGQLHFVHDGIFVSPEPGANDEVFVSAELEGAGGGDVLFQLWDPQGELVASNHTSTTAVDGPQEVRAVLRPKKLERWSVQSPQLYRVTASVSLPSGELSDEMNVTAGFRQVEWGVNPSFSLNSEAFKLLGFSHHNSIGGLGVALPERVNLFRIQASRALGANTWRSSHNPYPSALYDMLDATGTLCWEENRDYGAKYGGGAYVEAMREMVKRGRNHPSIVIWSVCNEFECTMNDANYTAKAFRTATKRLDPTRAVGANMIPNYGDLMEARPYLDVQGFSHKGNDTFEEFHRDNPTTPSVSSECSSCNSNRLVRNESDCGGDVNSPALLPYVAGSLGVWTMMDYFGEPAGTGTSGWPKVAATSGHFDMAGFPKVGAYWYPINWLHSGPEAGRPLAKERPVTRILDLPDRLHENVSAASSAPVMELFMDGRSLGRQITPADAMGNLWRAQWPVKLATFQRLELQAQDESGKTLATHVLYAPGAGKRRLHLAIDVPSEATATGRALVLDGRDMALLRASIVEPVADRASVPGVFLGAEAEGFALVSTATDHITWRVVSGPGRLAGTSNGDEASHEWLKSESVEAYGGLARGFVQVSQDCTSPNRELASRIDLDSGRAELRASCSEEPIIVEASAEGFESVRLSIPVSGSLDDAPLAVAARSATKDFTFTYLDDFLG